MGFLHQVCNPACALRLSVRHGAAHFLPCRVRARLFSARVRVPVQCGRQGWCWCWCLVPHIVSVLYIASLRMEPATERVHVHLLTTCMNLAPTNHLLLARGARARFMQVNRVIERNFHLESIEERDGWLQCYQDVKSLRTVSSKPSGRSACTAIHPVT